MRFRRRILLLGLGLLIPILLLAGERRLPTGPDGWAAPQQASAASPPLRTNDSEFSVATFNVHGCKGPDGDRDPRRIAALLEDLDIVGLNEVHGSPWATPNAQVFELAQLCQLPSNRCVFAPAETQWFGLKRFGNGLLARHPLLTWQRIPLPRRHDHSCRNMLVAQVGQPDRPVSILVTHIPHSNSQEREAQLEIVLNTFMSLEPPAVLLADLNTQPGDPRMVRFLAESDAIDAVEQGGVHGNNRVDWILARGLTCLDSNRIDNDASDHPLFTARLATR